MQRPGPEFALQPPEITDNVNRLVVRLGGSLENLQSPDVIAGETIVFQVRPDIRIRDFIVFAYIPKKSAMGPAHQTGIGRLVGQNLAHLGIGKFNTPDFTAGIAMYFHVQVPPDRFKLNTLHYMVKSKRRAQTIIRP